MAGFRYSIKDLENFTQIKSHTIRIWEQRYGLLQPERTDTNIRYYSESDFKKILNIKLLYTSGIKISKIAALSEDEIIKNAKSYILGPQNNVDKKIHELTLLILDFKNTEIEDYLHNELVKQDLQSLYMNLILPLLTRLGELWQVNSIDVIHEHFFSNVFREFIVSRINSLPAPLENSNKILLFLHDNEEHEFSILMYYFLLKEKGFHCHYFGQKVPIKEIEKAQKHIDPKFVITTFTAKLKEKTFDKISSVLILLSKHSTVIISGSQINSMKTKLPKDIHTISSIEELNNIVDLD